VGFSNVGSAPLLCVMDDDVTTAEVGICKNASTVTQIVAVKNELSEIVVGTLLTVKRSLFRKGSMTVVCAIASK
jgi:hypothetical protein